MRNVLLTNCHYSNVVRSIDSRGQKRSFFYSRTLN